MTRLHRAFEVLRVVISASNDQEIFHATGDKDFPILDKPEIAGSEEWPLAGILESRAKRVRGFVGFIPIALCGARAGKPDFSDLLHRATGTRFGMGDHHPGIADRHATSDHPSNVPPIRAGLNDRALFQRCGIQRRDGGRHPFALQRNKERVFRHSVCGGKGVAPESGWRECLGKPFDGIRRDGLGPAARDLPT